MIIELHMKLHSLLPTRRLLEVDRGSFIWILLPAFYQKKKSGILVILHYLSAVSNDISKSYSIAHLFFLVSPLIVPAKAVELYLDARRVIEEQVKVCLLSSFILFFTSDSIVSFSC